MFPSIGGIEQLAEGPGASFRSARLPSANWRRDCEPILRDDPDLSVCGAAVFGAVIGSEDLDLLSSVWVRNANAPRHIPPGYARI